MHFIKLRINIIFKNKKLNGWSKKKKSKKFDCLLKHIWVNSTNYIRIRLQKKKRKEFRTINKWMTLSVELCEVNFDTGPNGPNRIYNRVGLSGRCLSLSDSQVNHACFDWFAAVFAMNEWGHFPATVGRNTSVGYDETI